MLILFIISFVEECEIIRIFLFSVLSCYSCFFWHFIILILLFIFWSYLMITHAFIAHVSSNIALILSVADTNVMGIIVSWETGSILMITFLITNSCCCWCSTSLACCVTCTTLIIVVTRFLLNILSLSYLRTSYLHSFRLLNEKHISVITWGFYYFGPSSSAFHIHSYTLIKLEIWWAWRIINIVHLIARIALIILLSIRCSISSSKTTESRRIHLFL